MLELLTSMFCIFSAFTNSIYSLSLPLFPCCRWGSSGKWSDFPESPLRFNDRTKARTSSPASVLLSFPTVSPQPHCWLIRDRPTAPPSPCPIPRPYGFQLSRPKERRGGINSQIGSVIQKSFSFGPGICLCLWFLFCCCCCSFLLKSI